MTFWLISAILALAVTALFALAILRARAGAAPAAAHDVQVYRDQLQEIERDAARGLIGEGEAGRLRTEVSRRLLAADAEARKAPAPSRAAPRGAGWLAVTGIGAVLLGGGLALYLQLGAPGYGDLALKDRIAAARQTYETRPPQAEAEAQMPASPDMQVDPAYLQLMDKLRSAVAARPDDLKGHELLARNEAALGNFTAAHRAQAEVIALKGDAAEAADYIDLAELMIRAAGGYVSPEAEAALGAALEREPGQPTARYFTGLMMAQTGRPDIAFRLWEPLMREAPADAPWYPALRAQIEQAAARAGVDYQLPDAPGPDGAAPGGPAFAGPDAGDVAAAEQMSPADRIEMIRGMVSGLAERLATEGGEPSEWARLIGAYGVLGETGRAAAIWAEAQQVFAGKPQAMDVVREAARRAGVAE